MPIEPEDVLIFADYQVTGDSISDQKPPANISSAVADTRFKTHWVERSRCGPNETTVIRGTWTPTTCKHNVLNDSDIDTWSATGALPTSGHLEHLIVRFKRDWQTRSRKHYLCANVYLHLRYTVQFKELSENIMYPGPENTSSTILTYATDVTQLNPTY